MKNHKQVMSLQAKSGMKFIVEVDGSTITKVISVDSQEPKSQKVPDGFYQNEGGLTVRVYSNMISFPKTGVKPLAKRKPLSGIGKAMAGLRQKRKEYVSTMRFEGKM